MRDKPQQSRMYGETICGAVVCEEIQEQPHSSKEKAELRQVGVFGMWPGSNCRWLQQDSGIQKFSGTREEIFFLFLFSRINIKWHADYINIILTQMTSWSQCSRKLAFQYRHWFLIYSMTFSNTVCIVQWFDELERTWKEVFVTNYRVTNIITKLLLSIWRKA
jgi:hypothetical protein